MTAAFFYIDVEKLRILAAHMLACGPLDSATCCANARLANVVFLDFVWFQILVGMVREAKIPVGMVVPRAPAPVV